MLTRLPMIAMAGAVALATVATTQTAAAQDKEYTIDTETAAENADKKDGIEWGVSGAATLNLTDTRSVVGQTDGTSLTFGFNFNANLDVYEGHHEWRNNMAIVAGVARTATLPEFVKSQDSIDINSIYLYHFTDWFGAFARVAWNSSVFRGADVRPGLTDYAITRLEGDVNTVTATRLSLTDSFRPSRFKESIGLFAQPYASKPISLEARAGLGGRQTLAKGQLALSDNADTADVVEVTELDDVLQLGAEGALEIWGSFEENKITYRAGAEVLIPFLSNDNTEADLVDLTNVLLYVNVSFKVVEWASIDYAFRALREPQLLDKWQVQNQLLLTMGLAAGSAVDAPAE